MVSGFSRSALSPLLLSVCSSIPSTISSLSSTIHPTFQARNPGIRTGFCLSSPSWLTGHLLLSILSRNPTDPKAGTTGPRRKGKGGGGQDLMQTWGAAPAERARCGLEGMQVPARAVPGPCPLRGTWQAPTVPHLGFPPMPAPPPT